LGGWADCAAVGKIKLWESYREVVNKVSASTLTTGEGETRQTKKILDEYLAYLGEIETD
jgi:hypothetical protein